MKLILALTRKGGIARNREIPWNIADELKFFKQMTINNVVIMGRKTFESIGRLLPQRDNIIVGEGHTSLREAIRLALEFERNGKIVWVIGGAQMAELFQPYINEMFLSVLKNDVECDLFVPSYILTVLDIINRIFDKNAGNDSNDSNDSKDICAPKVHTRHSEYTVYQCFFTPNKEEIAFQSLINRILNEGTYSTDRTCIGTQSVFGHQLSFSLEQGRFPISTLRKSFFRGIFEELMWFLRGHTNAKILSEKGVKIWDDNPKRQVLDNLGLTHLKEGDCGAIYGHQWRHWGAKYIDCHTDYTGQGIDQISNLIKEIKTNPFSRRLLISGWNVGDLSEMCLPPCHTFYQFEVSKSPEGPNYLSCHYYQRSSDVLLAGKWNITSASLLTVLLAKVCGLQPKKLIVSYGNAHIYNNHRNAIDEYTRRFPFDYPTIEVITKENIWDYEYSDVKLSNYVSHPSIKGLEMNA